MKRRILVAVAVVALAVGAVFAWSYTRREVYLLGGVEDYIVLNRPLFGKPRVIDSLGAEMRASRVEAENTSVGIRLKFVSESESEFVGAGRHSYVQEYDLAPSQTPRGDYDAVAFRMYSVPEVQLATYGGAFDPPLPHLHRVQGNGAIKYLRNVYGATDGDKPTTAALTAQARELHNAAPDDLYLEALYLDALTGEQNFAELKSRVPQWIERVRASGNPTLELLSVNAHSALRWHELTSAGRNGFDVVNAMESPALDLAKRREMLLQLVQYTQGEAAPISLLTQIDAPNFLAKQVTVKVFCQLAPFACTLRM